MKKSHLSLGFLFLGLTLLGTLGSCTSKSPSLVSQTHWLLGTWESETSTGKIYEEWISTNKLKLSGRSYILKGGDTLVLETVTLLEEKGSLFYIPTVKNQNDGQAIRFGLKDIGPTYFVFENQQHDFPQVIAYHQSENENPISLIAKISGRRDGKDEERLFPMTKIK